jgi:hypothetical protein
MIRAEAKARLFQWREALIGLCVFGIGLYWLSGYGILPWIGGVGAAAGGTLIYTGIQRAQFRGGKGGPGLVSVDESEISYFGPFNGGTMSVREVSMLSLDPRSPPPVWVLSQAGQQDLDIPVNAEGTDQLFDAFAA